MKIYSILLVFFIISCTEKIDKKNVSLLNGYWEIEKVNLPNEESKEYKINESVDYFKISDNLKGFRKKLVPQYDGKFLTNEVQENISIFFNGDIAFITYKTDFATWNEEIVKLTNEELILKSEQGIAYVYKRKHEYNE